MQGKIKKIVTDKGYGFVSGDRGDVFFHCSSVVGAQFEQLQEGQSVEYQVEEDKRGPRATSVQVS
jgi:CspA family cold shock protein